jgi:predicted DNA-binding transcriptional regulator AlpA
VRRKIVRRKNRNPNPPPKASKQFAASTAVAVPATPLETKPTRLLDRVGLLKRVPYSYPTIWNWMRQEPPKFPRSRNTGGKAAWLESEVEEWIRNRPVNQFKKPIERTDESAEASR